MPLVKKISPLKQSQLWLQEMIQPGDEVVDATIGNGHDTLFLLQCLKQENTDIKGFLWGFDVQEQAVKNTQIKLSQEGITVKNYSLHLASHAQLASIVKSNHLAAVMFNLGYLPGTDKTVITQTNETLQALQAALNKLKLGGVLSIMCYPGHAGGDRESLAVASWVNSLDIESFSVKRVEAEFMTNQSAFLLWIQKNKHDACY